MCWDVKQGVSIYSEIGYAILLNLLYFIKYKYEVTDMNNLFLINHHGKSRKTVNSEETDSN